MYRAIVTAPGHKFIKKLERIQRYIYNHLPIRLQLHPSQLYFQINRKQTLVFLYHILALNRGLNKFVYLYETDKPEKLKERT